MIKSTCVFKFSAEPSSPSMCIFCLAECSSIVPAEMTSSVLHKVMGKYLRRNFTHTSFRYVAGKYLTRERKMFVECRIIFVPMNYNF